MDVQARPVREIMQREIAVLEPDERLDLAEDIMRLGRVRHMPVVEDGRLVGLVSSRDLLAASLTKMLEFDPVHRRTFLHGLRVDEVMTREIVTVEPDATLGVAARLMIRNKIGCLPVVKGDRALVGLVTETDVLEAAFGDEEKSGEGGKAMGLGDKFSEELEDLKRVRDELRVRIHLGKAEAKEVWEQAEHKLHQLESKVKVLSEAAEEPLHDVADAARLLVDEVREGFEKIRRAL